MPRTGGKHLQGDEGSDSVAENVWSPDRPNGRVPPGGDPVSGAGSVNWNSSRLVFRRRDASAEASAEPTGSAGSSLTAARSASPAKGEAAATVPSGRFIGFLLGFG